MKRTFISLACTCVAFVFAASLPVVCAAQDELPEDEPLVEAEPNPLFDLFYKVDDLLTAGDKDAATAMIVGALDDAQYAKQRTDLATVVQRFLLFTEQDAKAREIFLQTVRTEPETARPGFELIHGYYLSKGQAEEALAWARELLEQPLPDDMRRTAVLWVLNGLLENGDEDAFFAELPRLESFEPADACNVAAELCRSAYYKDRFDLLSKEIELFRAAPYGKDAAFAKTAAMYDLLAKAARSDWDGVEADFPNVLTLLDDRDLRFVLSRVFANARQQGNAAVAERIAMATLRSDAVRDFASVRQTAAREWVNLGVAADPACLPDRAAELRALGLPADDVFSNISRHLYDALNDLPTMSRIIEELDILRPLLSDDARRNSLDTLMLDAAFVTENYDRAYAIIEAGVPDRDEDWHTMTKTKILAHMALKKGDTDEAVKNFRAFMDFIAKTDETNTDPTTDIVYTPDSILGFNAKRIGDIYTKAGRTDEAAAAYAEARGYYTKALEAAKSAEEGKGFGPETIQYLENELKSLQ